MIDKNFFHVGTIVPKVETAMEQLGALLGLTWDGIHDELMPIYRPERGPGEVPLRVGYSTDRPFLELIEAVPGTPWELDQNGGSNLHHLGFSPTTSQLTLPRSATVSARSKSVPCVRRPGRQFSPTTTTWPAACASSWCRTLARRREDGKP